MDLRSYAKAKEIFDNTPMEKRPNSPLMERVTDITFAIAKEKIDRFNKQQEEELKKPHG